MVAERIIETEVRELPEGTRLFHPKSESNNRVWRRNMKLCYRGVSYDYTPPALEVSESEVLGHYRGRALRFSYVRHVPFPQPQADLTFRGNAYRKDTYGRVESVKPTQNAPKRASKFTPVFDSMAAARRQLLQESASVHQDNIRRSLERRIEAAQSRGDEALLHQLKEEMHQMA